MGRVTHAEINALKVQLEGLIGRANTLVGDLDEGCKNYTTALAALSKSVTNATTSATEAEGYNAAAKTGAEATREFSASAEEDYQSISKFASQVTTLSNKLSTEQGRLDKLTKSAEELKTTIESLLPGATSAGLASAYRERKESFRWPKHLWGGAFVVSMIVLFAVAYVDPITLEKTNLGSENIAAYILSRLPFVVPIIWLAVYAGRRHSQALRLEEDYAHKEALSKSFEGYKTQLLDIEEDKETCTSTLGLIERTLDALSLHPGRIYHGRHDDITPFNYFSSVLNPKKSGEKE